MINLAGKPTELPLNQKPLVQRQGLCHWVGALA